MKKVRTVATIKLHDWALILITRKKHLEQLIEIYQRDKDSKPSEQAAAIAAAQLEIDSLMKLMQADKVEIEMPPLPRHV